jgi:3-deoxy-D-manno-octulosonic-acid transferase
MRWLFDLLYLLGGILTAPVWVTRMVRTGKIRTAWKARFGCIEPLAASSKPRILLHAVSVGEVNAIRDLVSKLAQSDPPVDLVIATTTNTGYARARDLFAPAHHVVRYPFDFSFSVRRFLKAIGPTAVVLVELEVWPNFTRICAAKQIPISVVNGRLTQRSFKRYQLVRWAIRTSFQSLHIAAVQDEAYAARFRAMGVPADRVRITGTMKWDTSNIADDVPGSEQLAEDMGIDRTKPLIVAGSTAPDEHALLVSATPPGVQLLCAPRKPEWFDEAAAAMAGCARRSTGKQGSNTGRFLLDTIGELRMAYALADVVVVGRSFGQLHGSDMIEPIALGKPTVVGPAVADFAQSMKVLLAGDGVVQCTAAELPDVLAKLLADKDRASELAANGRAVIRAHQGATDRHVRIILDMLATRR